MDLSLCKECQYGKHFIADLWICKHPKSVTAWGSGNYPGFTCQNWRSDGFKGLGACGPDAMDFRPKPHYSIATRIRMWLRPEIKRAIEVLNGD